MAEILKNKEFMNDLMSIDCNKIYGLSRCITELSAASMRECEYKPLLTCENILTLMNHKHIKKYDKLRDILEVIDNQSEFDLIIKHANKLSFIHRKLVKVNNSSNNFREMSPETFSACLRNLCEASSLVENCFVLFDSNNKAKGASNDKVHRA